MKAIISKCNAEDLRYLSDVLDSYLSFTDDKRRKELLAAGDAHSRKQLIELMDKQIKYYGSSDIAYLKRAIFGGEGGVEAREIVEDVCKKLKVSVKLGGSVESMLERLVTAVVEKELHDKKPEELSDAFKNIGVGDADLKLVMEHVKHDAPVALLPVLVRIIGSKLTLSIVEAIVVGIIAQIVGREAAKHLVKEILKRNPMVNALGPVLWVISGTWLAYDLQGAAYRKTVPICLYLGMVAMRDGEEAE